MNNPKISIIVPIYNVEKYINRCLESLINQTLKEIEIILVDDGSPDNCPRICDEYVKKDNRIKVIHKKNEGLGFARNSGLEIAKGEYVAFVDSDDFVDIKMYEELYNVAKLKNLNVLFSNYYRVDKNNNISKIIEVNQNIYINENNEILHFLLNMIGSQPKYKEDRKYSMSVWHGIYQNKIIKEFDINFPSERDIVSEDIFFQIKFLLNSQTIGYINNYHYFYCENEMSLSNSFREDRFEKYKKLHSEINKLLINLFPQNIQIISNSIDRLFIGYVRRMCLEFKLELNDFKKILNDSYLQKIVKRYPYTELPNKHKLFIHIIRFRLTSMIFILNKIINFKYIGNDKNN